MKQQFNNQVFAQTKKIEEENTDTGRRASGLWNKLGNIGKLKKTESTSVANENGTTS